MGRFTILAGRVFHFVSRGVWGGYFYGGLMAFFLFVLFCLRLPYAFGLGGLSVAVFYFIFPIFFGLFLYRLGRFSLFFSSFVPEGTPPEMASFVCLAETVSYLIRPFVLMLRPVVNLSIGCFASHSFGSLFLIDPVTNGWLFVPFVLLFFYEIFVTLVHWFIVCEILCFSSDH